MISRVISFLALDGFSLFSCRSPSKTDNSSHDLLFVEVNEHAKHSVEVERSSLLEQILCLIRLKTIHYLLLHELLRLEVHVVSDLVDFLVDAEHAALKLVSFAEKNDDQVDNEE